MESQTLNIRFTISEKEFDEELNLPSGNYEAEVKKVSTTTPVQYQVLNLKCDAPNAESLCYEEQLILMRNESENNDHCVWLEAHHNSCSPTIQAIGAAIETAFEEQPA